MDKKGIIVSLIIAVLMIYVANQTAWTIEIIKAFAESGEQLSFFDTYRYLFDILKEIEIASGDNTIISSFYGDLIIGYMLSAIAIIPYTIRMFKAIKGNTKLRQID